MGILKTVKKAAKKTKNAALDVSPVGLLYAAGGGLNELTGGDTKTFRLSKAMKDGDKGTTYSKTVQAASGYQGRTQESGTWSLPVVNRSTTTGIGQVAATVVRDVAAPVANETSKALLGADLKTVLWVAGGAAAGLGTLYVVRSTPSR